MRGIPVSNRKRMQRLVSYIKYQITSSCPNLVQKGVPEGPNCYLPLVLAPGFSASVLY